MTTITASTTVGIDLNPAFYTSPIVIGAGVTVSNPGYPYAVYRHSGATTFFVIDNDGAISSNFGIGVYLAPGGSVTNAATASIIATTGVKISGGAGTVLNYGSIAGSSDGVDLSSGGSVTNQASGSITASGYGVRITGGAGTVVNYGSITGRVDLSSGGSVTNQASGSITTSGYGVSISGGPGTVVNDGSIKGYGISLVSGGSVTNGASAHITGFFGIFVSGGAGTVVNYGSIAETSYWGIKLASGGSVTNQVSGHIEGYNGVEVIGGTLMNAGSIGGRFGVYISDGTLTNSGAIIGNKGTAVAFGGTGSDLLVLDPGFEFSGIVAGGISSSNTLELATTASIASAGTVTGLGTQVLRFRSIVFDPGAQWSISGIQRGLAGPISGFAVRDTIELTGVTATGSSFVGGILTLDLSGGGSATLNLPGTFTSASDFKLTNVAAGADVSLAAPCFVAGTRIGTPSGEVAVEELAKDQLVLMATGEARPVRWIGHRRISLATHPRLETVAPIHIQRDAFDDNMPHRDLLVSPDHAIFVDGKLICAKQLVNGTTIRTERDRTTVDYYHVELDVHGILLAEGLPAESYLDTGNRGSFANSGAPLVLHPDMADETDYPTREADSCSPFVWDEANVQPIWQRLADRAAAIGLPGSQCVTTADADLRLLADRHTVKPVFSDSDRVIFALPRGAREVRLVSRAQAPTRARPWLGDQRRLGVRVKRIALHGSDGPREVPLDHPDLTRGWSRPHK